MSTVVNLYLDLLKKCVSNFIYDDDLDMMRGRFAVEAETGKVFSVKPAPAQASDRLWGTIWPTRAHTMIGMTRLNNIQYCAVQVLKAGVRGDFIETGVWRGGASIFMRGLLKAYGVSDRTVWVADSFEGLPLPDPKHYPKESKLNHRA